MVRQKYDKLTALMYLPGDLPEEVQDVLRLHSFQQRQGVQASGGPGVVGVCVELCPVAGLVSEVVDDACGGRPLLGCGCLQSP
jgi:hypothetical protein